MAALGLVILGCGGAERLLPLSSPVPAAGWWVDELVSAAADKAVITFTTRDAVVALTVDDDGALQGWRSEDGEPFEPMPVGTAVVEGLSLTAGVARGDDAVAVGMSGSSSSDRAPRVFVSTAGGPWTEVVTSGLEGALELGDVVATDDGYVIVGTRPSAGESGSGFTVPVAWRSTDARTWTEAILPFGLDGGVSGLTTIGDQLLAVGRGGPAGLIWRSKDGGTTWDLLPAKVDGIDGAFVMHDLALARGALVGLGFDSTQPAPSSVIVRSLDGGRTWQRTAGAGGVGDSLGGARIGSGMWGFTIVTRGSAGAAEPTVLRSLDGGTWAELDLRKVEGLGEVDEVRFQPSGTMVLVGSTGDGRLSAWTWSNGSEPPPTLPLS